MDFDLHFDPEAELLDSEAHQGGEEAAIDQPEAFATRLAAADENAAWNGHFEANGVPLEEETAGQTAGPTLTAARPNFEVTSEAYESEVPVYEADALEELYDRGAGLKIQDELRRRREEDQEEEDEDEDEDEDEEAMEDLEASFPEDRSHVYASTAARRRRSWSLLQLDATFLLAKLDGCILFCTPVLGLLTILIVLILKKRITHFIVGSVTTTPLPATTGPPGPEEVAFYDKMSSMPTMGEFLEAFSIGTAWTLAFASPQTGSQPTKLAGGVGDGTPALSTSDGTSGLSLSDVMHNVSDMSGGGLISEIVLIQAALLCARSEQDPQTFVVYAAEQDLGQMAYMLGSSLPSATVLTLHPSRSASWGHARLLGPMRFPGGLELRSVLSAGLWGEGADLVELAATPVIVDVQVVIGISLGEVIFTPHILRAVLSMSRWTLISFPLDPRAHSIDVGSALRRALVAGPSGPEDQVMRFDAHVAALGILRVPATQDMHALFLVRTRWVERRVQGMWHEVAGITVPRQPDTPSYFLSFGAGRNGSVVNTRGFPSEPFEAAGMLLETLIALGLPLTERVYLMALALRDLQPGPASWVVCCGGIWQWCGRSTCNMLPPGAVGAVSYIACAFGVSAAATELLFQSCVECVTCDREQIFDGYLPSTCERCALCILTLGLAQALVPPLDRAANKASTTLAPQLATMPVIDGFAGPIVDDVPGIGDLANAQVPGVVQCAVMCNKHPKCLSFEFSPSVTVTSSVLNCQLNSARARAGVPFQDFVLYVKKGVPGSVEEGLPIAFATTEFGNGGVNVSSVDSSSVPRSAAAQPWPASPVSFEVEVEGFIAAGSPFGGNSGWRCAKASPSPPSDLLDYVDAAVLNNCPHEDLTWEMIAPPGLYEVEVVLQVRRRMDTATVPSSCQVQGRRLSFAFNGTDDTVVTHTRRVDRVLVASNRNGFDPVVRLQGCQTDKTRVVLLRLRRTWRQCPHVKAFPVPTVTDADTGPGGRYIKLTSAPASDPR